VQRRSREEASDGKTKGLVRKCESSTIDVLVAAAAAVVVVVVVVVLFVPLVDM